MYARLVLKSVSRSAKDYFIYILTISLSVTLFYSFLSISSKYYKPNLGGAYDIAILGDGMKIAICAITLCLVFLIRYVNHYMMLQRQKEFAVQLILGMDSKTLGGLFFAETFIMGLLSIFIGIFFGMICSQFITAMLLNVYEKEYQFSWSLFPDTVLFTILFFLCIFVVVGIANLFKIQRTKIIDMLYAEKKNEPNIKKSRWIYCVLFVYAILLLFRIIVGVQKLYFYYDSRFPIAVQMMFFGNVVFPIITFLVIVLFWRKKVLLGVLLCSIGNMIFAASIPFFMNRYDLVLGKGTLNQYLLFICLDLSFFLCTFIYLSGRMIQAWKHRCLEYQYQGGNLFFFGQIISKLNTSSQMMSVASITLVLSILLFLTAPILTNWAFGYLDTRSMYDIQIFSTYNQVYEEEDLPHDSYDVVTEVLYNQGIQSTYDCTFHLYLPEHSSFHNRVKYDFPILAISCSDYNYIRTMLGLETISLGEEEFITHWKAVATKEEREDYLKKTKEFMTDAGVFKISEQPYYTENMGNTLFNSYTNVVIVLPDYACEKLLPVIQNRYILTEQAVSYQEARDIEKAFYSIYQEGGSEGANYGIRLRTLQLNSTKANSFLLQASMFYAAVVLMVISLAVLSLQQLLEGVHYKYRFCVLKNIGIEDKEIETLILKQLGIWFGIPIVSAFVVSSIIFVYFMQLISIEISAYTNFYVVVGQIGITLGLIALIFLCYFFSTWRITKNLLYS